MRLTEMISFLNKNPTTDDIHHYTHIDVDDLKHKFKVDKEFSRFVRQQRKEEKGNSKRKVETEIDLFDFI
jgi:hypothetical protein